MPKVWRVWVARRGQRRKKEKLLIITPSGKEYEIGFLSPCKDGFVLGASQIEGMNTPHLTVLNKKGTISSHITPQYQGDREYFPPTHYERNCKKVSITCREPDVIPITSGAITPKYSVCYKRIVQFT